MRTRFIKELFMPFSKRSGAHAAGHGKKAKGVSSTSHDAGVRSGTQFAYDFDKEEAGAGKTVPLTPLQQAATDGAAGAVAVPLKKNGKPKMKKGKKIALAIILVVAAILAVAGVAGALYVNNLNNILQGSDSQEKAQIADSLAPTEGDNPFYMVLLGCDDREGVEGARADTTILARVDPGKAKVTLLSIPRDTAINIEGHGVQKFNAAYAFDGTSGAIDATSKLCGVKISHYAEVHFDHLIELIDYMGGVEVDVPMDIDDADAGGKLKAGKQTLSGEQAMIFARSRSYATGDFQRTTNQRILIEAALKKLMSMSATDLPGVINKMATCVTTDYDVNSLITLAGKFKDTDNLTIYSALMPSKEASGSDGASYVVVDTKKLEKMMKVIDSGGDPATVESNDNTVTSSKEAKKKGTESYVNTGTDDTGDDTVPDYNSASVSVDSTGSQADVGMQAASTGGDATGASATSSTGVATGTGTGAASTGVATGTGNAAGTGYGTNQ
jgi:LCP family protein required for cell wall assembly